MYFMFFDQPREKSSNVPRYPCVYHVWAERRENPVRTLRYIQTAGLNLHILVKTKLHHCNTCHNIQFLFKLSDNLFKGFDNAQCAENVLLPPERSDPRTNTLLSISDLEGYIEQKKADSCTFKDEYLVGIIPS